MRTVVTKRRLAGATALVAMALTAGITVFVLAGTGSSTASGGATSPVPVSPALTPTPSPSTPSTTPRARRRATATHWSTPGRHAAVTHRTQTGSGGVPPADPCAHNHHCYVPPAPPATPHYTLSKAPTKSGDLPPGVPVIG